MRPWSHPTREHCTNSATLSIRKPRGKRLSQTLTRSPQTKLRHFRFVVLCFRQADRKTRAAVVTIFSRDGPAMVVNDAAGDREPHSGAFRFCRKEWLEKLLNHCPWKTRTRITHADENVSVSITARMNDKASRIGAHSRHCFKGVDREIEQHLQQLHAICHYTGAVRINFDCYCHVPSQSLGVDNPEEIANCVTDLD